MNFERHAILYNDQQLGPYPLEKLKKVSRPTTEYTEEIKQINGSHALGPYIAKGDYGEKQVEGFKKIELKEPMFKALWDVQTHLAAFNPTPVNINKAELPNDPRVLTRHIKSFGYFLGADMIGVCKMPKSAYYSHNAAGEKLAELNYKYAIVFMCRKNTTVIDQSYGNEWVDDSISFQVYQKLLGIATTVNDYIHLLGYPARYSAQCNYVNIMPQLIVESGLGEGSRMGPIVNPFIGAVSKVSAVLTDLPLIPDKPIDFGLQKYCENCRICADVCPANAVTYGPKRDYNGYKPWRLRGIGERAGENCKTYTTTNRYGKVCGRCVSLCPWNRPDSTPKDFEKWDGDPKFLYDSVNRQAQFLKENNYVHPDEKSKKWWIPLVWDEKQKKYMEAPEWDYEVHERKMKILKEQESDNNYNPEMPHTYSINNEKCIDCGICIDECPIDIISRNDNKEYEIDQDKCLDCGVCHIFCPADAVIKNEASVEKAKG